MEEELQIVQTYLKEKFKDEATGHDWHHIHRVYVNALEIQKHEGGNKKIISYAALLHDISDHKFNGGDFERGGQIAQSLLIKWGVSSKQVTHITEIISNMSFSKSIDGAKDLTLEGQIVQDADRLDAIGAIGIARTFAYGGHKGNPIYTPDLPIAQFSSKEAYLNHRSSTIHHFYEKLLLLKDKMNTKTGKKMAEKRHQFMVEFLDQFYAEWNVNSPL